MGSLPLSPWGAGPLEGAGPQRSQAGWGRAGPGGAGQTPLGWLGLLSAGGRVPACPGEARRNCHLFLSPIPPTLWTLVCVAGRGLGPGVRRLAQLHSLPRKAPYLRGLLFCSPILVGAASFYGNGIWGQLAGGLGARARSTGSGGPSRPGPRCTDRSRAARAPSTGLLEDRRGRVFAHGAPLPRPGVHSRYIGQMGRGTWLSRVFGVAGCHWLEWHSSPLMEPQVQCERRLQASLRTFCPPLSPLGHG